MLSVNRLREFLIEAKEAIEGINRAVMVVDDSELVRFMEDHKPGENTLLVGVMPQFHTIGRDDSIKMVNQLQFFIVDKSTTKSINHDEYLQMFERTQDIAREFLYYLLGLKTEGDFCGIWAELQEHGIEIVPVWRKAMCNGWVISIDLISNV